MKSVRTKYFIKAALIWAGCFAMFFLVYMFTLAPQKNSKEELEKQLAEKKRVHNFALEATQAETRVELNEQIKGLREKLRNFVVDFEDATNLTFDISKIANEKEVTSFSIEIKKGSGGSRAKGDKYVFENYISISFSSADFNQFAAFLNALERHRPVILVDGFAITRASNKAQEHRTSMNLAVFVRKM
jgi:hypothetical protein